MKSVRASHRTKQEPESRIYPNPAKDSFILESPAEAILRIYNENGAEIHQEKIKEGSNIIHTNHLPKGIYAVQVGSTTSRLVIYSK